LEYASANRIPVSQKAQWVATDVRNHKKESGDYYA
jgi:hypothetical protein